MASETSELTFVRCPSCRSLVPASAARCRICNNQLEGTANGAGGDATRPAGRVRQKTISASADELMNAENYPADDGTPPVAVPVNQFGSPSAGGTPIDEENDPLAAFLQEFEDSPEPIMSAPPASSEIPAAAVANDDDDDDDLDSFLDEFEDFGGSPEPVAEPQAAPVEHPLQVAPLATAPLQAEDSDPFDIPEDPLAHFTTTVDDDDFGIEATPEPQREAAPPMPEPDPEPTYVPEPPPVKRPEPPRQAVDKRPAAPPPQAQQRASQVQHKAPPPPQQELKQARPASDDRGGRDNRGGSQGGHQERRDNRERDRHDSNRNDRRPEESKKANASQGGRQHDRHQERHAERSHAQPESHTAGPKTGKMRPGRLFGWLVSFESPDGRAIELREGKFFITGSSIRGTDLVIEDPSISTPHALMSVSAEHGLLIQDLMSERGVFMRSGDRGQYRREDGIIELKHGDWIRFGDVEFLLTVVPGGK